MTKQRVDELPFGSGTRHPLDDFKTAKDIVFSTVVARSVEIEEPSLIVQATLGRVWDNLQSYLAIGDWTDRWRLRNQPTPDPVFTVIPPPSMVARIGAHGALVSELVENETFSISMTTVIADALGEHRAYLEATQRNGPGRGKAAQKAHALHEAKLQLLVALLEAVA